MFRAYTLYQMIFYIYPIVPHAPSFVYSFLLLVTVVNYLSSCIPLCFLFLQCLMNLNLSSPASTIRIAFAWFSRWKKGNSWGVLAIYFSFYYALFMREKIPSAKPIHQYIKITRTMPKSWCVGYYRIDYDIVFSFTPCHRLSSKMRREQA